ncbi:TAXI family TRAP transporter solute-binding subunit [Thalassospira marina]|uniref:TAXI family TRAP transporter solute-binding subunit n=1 Tax=Thalassospira marina TaxID=2048283 RepID=UPI001C2BFC5A|nr:TAXI family TRAP transporter solute-binding subunit [Thalassospira marina]
MCWNIKHAAKAFVAVALIAPALLGHAQAGQGDIAIGTGGVTGIYYPAGGAICEMVNRESQATDLRCFTESTAGSIANIRALRDGSLDFAIVQSDWVYHAYHGTSVFASDGPFDGLRVVFELHSEPFTLVARKGSGITGFEDLKGKKVNIGLPGSGQRSTMDVVMKAYGMDYDALGGTTELSETGMAKAICNGEIDAMVYTVGHPAAAISDVANNCEVELVNVEGPAIDKLVSENGFYQKVSIPADLYEGTGSAVNSFGVRAVLVTTAKEPAGTVNRLTTDVLGHFADFARLHDSFSVLKPEDMINDHLAPIHEGALSAIAALGLQPQP